MIFTHVPREISCSNEIRLLMEILRDSQIFSKIQLEIHNLTMTKSVLINQQFKNIQSVESAT